MVYASIKEAWGIDDFCKEPPDNPYVVKDPIQDKANFKDFEKNFSRDELSTANLVPSGIKNRKKYTREPSIDSSIDSSINYKNKSKYDSSNEPRQRKYFLDKNDEYSEISSDETSRDSYKKMIGKKIKIKHDKPNKSIIKDIHEGFETRYHPNRHHDTCSNMLDHLRTCRICREEVEEYSKNTFIKEFIIFAGSGIIMFLFLDLLRKIAQRAP